MAKVSMIEPIAVCSAELNGSFKKLTSETLYFRNDKDVADFNFSVCYPDKSAINKFTIRVKFLKDNGERRISYRIDDSGKIINMSVFNVTNSVCILGGMKKVTEIEGKNFYIEPEISVYDDMKKVTIILYHT